MALVGKKSYPKATVKKIIKAHSDLNIKKNADVTVCTPRTRFRRPETRTDEYPQIYLNYVLFMES
jgi:hypothetical protein